MIIVEFQLDPDREQYNVMIVAPNITLSLLFFVVQADNS